MLNSRTQASSSFIPNESQGHILTLMGFGLLLLALLALAGWTLFSQLGEGSLYDWDEATYGQIAREMARDGDWMTPHWNGQPFFDKPPVVLWLMALGMERVSTAELAVRLPAALFGLFTLVLTFLLGWKMVGRGAAVVATLMLLVASEFFSSSFVGLARQGMLDVPLTAMAAWAVLHLWLGLQDRRHWLLMGLPLGLAFMIRSFSAGPLYVLIGLSILLLPLVGERWTVARWQALIGGAFVAALVGLPWHIGQLFINGQSFFDDYVGRNLFGMASEAADNLEGDWTYYLETLRQGFPAWWWLIAPALLWALWRLVRQRESRAMILLTWAILPFTLYSIAASKLAWYVLIVYPALALLVGWFVWQLVPPNPFVQAGVLTLLLLGTAYWNSQTISPLHPSWAVKAVGWCAVNAVPSGETIVFFDPERSYKSDQRDFWNIRPSIRYYADRPMVGRWQRAEIEQWLAEGGRFVWTHAKDAPLLDGLFVLVGREDTELLLRRASATDVPPVPEGVCHQ
jgi:4-amino-4-deoxy-L-arabinose transferase-like glycosyltransferase